MIVVTGAAGLVGNVLLRTLVDDGATGLRAVVRPGGRRDSIADLDVEVVEADVRDRDALAAAFRGAEVVYHTAGTVSIARGGLERLREANVEGTRAVVSASKEAGVGRLVYTSSVHAFVEAPWGTCLDEAGAVDPADVRGAYAKAKAEATLLVLDAAREGLDAVVVYPSGIIGPYDFRPSHMGALVVASAHGRLGAYVHGAYNFVDVRDVAQGLMAAAAKGRRGEGYILAGHEVTVRDLLQAIEAATGVPAPRLRLPIRLIRALSPVIPVYYWATRQQPLFTSYSLDVICSNCSMSPEKAEHELGFTRRPFKQTLEDTVSWFARQGII